MHDRWRDYNSTISLEPLMTPRKAAPAQPRHVDIIVEGCDVPLEEGNDPPILSNKKQRDVNDNVNRL